MKRIVLLLLALIAGNPAVARATEDTGVSALTRDADALRAEVLRLNQELFLLEEELLFPASTQLSVFLSVDVGEFFSLDAVELKIDDEVVSAYLYTEREVGALHRGGIQQLFVGNLKRGEHELVAVFTGRGPSGRDYRRATSLRFDKGIGPHYLELQISDAAARQQPEFVVRSWD